jgi:LysM repeat protein
MRRLWVAFLLAAVLLGSSAATVAARQQHGARPLGHHVVKTGETLWEIARATYPSRDPRQVVEALSRSNDLRGRPILPGQNLLLPKL